MPQVADAYAALVAAGELKVDPDQAKAAAALDRFGVAMGRTRTGFLSRLFGRETPARSGVYLWGGVGRGKSMLMDLAFRHIAVEPKRRVHFHAFMLEVHERLRAARKTEEGDPVLQVAEQYADEVRFLAFDEMMVTNPPDAMIMSRLFTQLLDRGVGLVTTSNRPPTDLYRDGLNRDLFLPFIPLVEARLEVVGLNGPTDYRLDRLAGPRHLAGAQWRRCDGAIERGLFPADRLSGRGSGAVPSEELDVGGGRDAARPEEPQGGRGLLVQAIVRGSARAPPTISPSRSEFHTVILVGIPVMTREMRNEASRFVTLIDQLYEHKVKLLAAADAEAPDLYPAGDGQFRIRPHRQPPRGNAERRLSCRGPRRGQASRGDDVANRSRLRQQGAGDHARFLDRQDFCHHPGRDRWGQRVDVVAWRDHP